MTPKLIMLCGPSASGKSTTRAGLLDGDLPAILAAGEDAVVVSRDDVLEEWGAAAGIDYQAAYLKWSDEAEGRTHEILGEAVSAGRNVIWDQTNLTPEVRAANLARIPESYETIALSHEAPRDELDRRLRAREEETGKHIPDIVLDKQVEMYRRPAFEEGFDRILAIAPVETARALVAESDIDIQP